MSFWDFASKDVLAVCVILYFFWCVIDRVLGAFTETREVTMTSGCRCDPGRFRRMEARLQKLERERKQPGLWYEKTVTTTTEKPTQNEKEKPHE